MANGSRIIGRNAGKIYQLLAIHGRMTALSLQKEADIEDLNQVHEALLWLSRQLLIISETSRSSRRGLFAPSGPAVTYYRLSASRSLASEAAPVMGRDS